MRSLALLVAVSGILLAGIRGPAAQIGSGGSGRWYKGNTHTHTLNSDGDSTPDDVAKWYREHGYQFLVLSDHNVLTNPDGLNAVHGASEQFLLIKGEEVTDRFGDKPIHINGLDVSENVEPAARLERARRGAAYGRRDPEGRTASPTSTTRTSAGPSPPTT